MRVFYLTFCLLLFNIHNAYAYLDPGTGSIILQALIGFIAAIGATVGLYWQKFKFLIKKIFTKNKKQN
jgi:uncharacterized membrane protein